MFACLYAPNGCEPDALLAIARDFTPRYEQHAPHLITLDISGLGSLLGPPRAIGEELRRAMADRHILPRVAVATTRTAALIHAHAKAGLTVVDPGEEAAALAPLPLSVLTTVAALKQSDDATPDRALTDLAQTLKRWGLKTLGDLAALPRAELSARLGAGGLAWQDLARGVDPRPLVPSLPEERFEQSLELEWPIEGLEPLSFVLGRLFEALSAHLERRDRGAAVLHVRLRLVAPAAVPSERASEAQRVGVGPHAHPKKAIFSRSLQLPTPLRDARTLRTLALLDLEAHPPPAGVDRVTVAVDPAPGPIVQFSLLSRAQPAPERVSTLLARLTALVGEGHVGSPRLVDSYRPGVFDMKPFTAEFTTETTEKDHFARNCAGSVSSGISVVNSCLRRLRRPIPARVLVEHGRPVRVVTERRGFGGGRVEHAAGPWLTSGEWWKTLGLGARGSGLEIHALGLGARGSGVEDHAPGLGPRGSGAPRAVESACGRAERAAALSRRGGGAPRQKDDVRGTARDSPEPPWGWGPTASEECRAPRAVKEDIESRAAEIYARHFLVQEDPAAVSRARSTDPIRWPTFKVEGWHREEWDVTLGDGGSYRIYRDCDRDRWFVDAIID